MKIKLSRANEERFLALKFYYGGEFWRDLWRVYLPIIVVATVGILVSLP